MVGCLLIQSKQRPHLIRSETSTGMKMAWFLADLLEQIVASWSDQWNNVHLPFDVTSWTKSRQKTSGKSDLIVGVLTLDLRSFVTHPNKPRTKQSASLYQRMELKSIKEWNLKSARFKGRNCYQWQKLWSVWRGQNRFRSQPNTRSQLHLPSSLDRRPILPSLIQCTLIHLYQKWVRNESQKMSAKNSPVAIFLQTIFGFGDPLAEHLMTWFDPWLILTSFGSSIQVTGAN